MAAKVVWYRNAWWVRTHHGGRKKDRRIGPKKADERQAEEIARKINAAIALGQFGLEEEAPEPLPCDAELRRWHRTYTPTMKASYEAHTRRLIDQHLVPFFGSRDLREIGEPDLLAYVRAKLDAGLAPSTIRNGLAVLQRVLSLRQREGLIARNPAARLGELIRRVDRRTATEVRTVDAWTREEVGVLLDTAARYEPRFEPVLAFLFATGARRGEALGLKWEDVDFEARRIAIRRAISSGELTTPKSGRGRQIAMPAGLASRLFDLLAERRKEALQRGWREAPEWVFCSRAGTALDERNLERAWFRVRRRAQKEGVRPLKLHCTRHTYASMALAAGKSVRWVAEQLGHSSPMLTLKTYAHVMREEETDLSFAEFGPVGDGSGRLYTSPTKNGAGDDAANPAPTLVELVGIEPTTPRLPAFQARSSTRGRPWPEAYGIRGVGGSNPCPPVSAPDSRCAAL